MGYLDHRFLMALELPVLGGTFSASIETTGVAGAILVGYSSPATLVSSSWGNVLVDIYDPSGELLHLPPGFMDPANFDVPVPSNIAFCGFRCSTQAARFGGGIDLTNAQDLVLGY